MPHTCILEKKRNGAFFLCVNPIHTYKFIHTHTCTQQKKRNGAFTLSLASGLEGPGKISSLIEKDAKNASTACQVNAMYACAFLSIL
jgi:hypothetical protein